MSERTRNRKSYKEALKTVRTRGHITPKDKRFLTKESYPKGSLGDISNQKPSILQRQGKNKRQSDYFVEHKKMQLKGI